MKLLLKTVLLLIALFIIAYQNSTEPQQTEPNSDYFPLAVGNKWYYQTWNHQTKQFEHPEYIESTMEVIRPRQLDGKLFYLVESCSMNSDGTIRAKDSIYYNISGDTLYQISVHWEFKKENMSIRAIFADTGHVRFKMKWYDDYYEANSQLETDSTMNFAYYMPLMCDSGSELTIKKHVGFSEYISYQTPYNSRLVKYELK